MLHKSFLSGTLLFLEGEPIRFLSKEGALQSSFYARRQCVFEQLEYVSFSFFNLRFCLQPGLLVVPLGNLTAIVAKPQRKKQQNEPRTLAV